jgi:hypothetical protein
VRTRQFPVISVGVDVMSFIRLNDAAAAIVLALDRYGDLQPR